MKYQIDQSGKIENTNKNTILCVSNKNWYSVMIKAKTKRQIQEIFRRNGQPKNFVIFTFSAGLTILLEQNNNVSDVLVDQEYPGKMAIIKKLVQEMCINKKSFSNIYFGLIGKKSMAHHRAYAVSLKKLKAKKIISLKELMNKIKMTEVGKRLKNA